MRAAEPTIELRPLAPYSFPLALSYLASSPSSVLESVDPERGHYQRALRFDGSRVVITMQSIGTVESPRIELRVAGEVLAPGVCDRVRQRISQIFLFDVDPTPFQSITERDPVLGSIARDHPGLRPLLVADPYEALIFAIVGQQVNIAFARRMKRALIEQFGERVTIAGREASLLPTPEQIAALDPAELRKLQFSRQKADYLIQLSQEIASGNLRLDALRNVPLEEGIAELTGYRGIGRWTAEYVLMRGLGASDSIPAGDLGLRKIVGYAYGLGRTASEAEVRQIADAWAGWRGWAAFLWWLELQTNNLSRFAR